MSSTVKQHWLYLLFTRIWFKLVPQIAFGYVFGKVNPYWSLVCPHRMWSIRFISEISIFITIFCGFLDVSGEEEEVQEGDMWGSLSLLAEPAQAHALSVPSPSHPHKHCLTLVESNPLCWLNMSLLQAFLWFFFFIFTALFLLTHILPCASLKWYNWVITEFCFVLFCFLKKKQEFILSSQKQNKSEGIPSQGRH